MKIIRRQRMLYRILFIVSSTLMVFFTFSLFAYSPSAGDYRSAATGSWNNVNTWQIYNGTGWVAAIATPTSSDGVITIQSGNTVTVTASVTVDQVSVSAGGQITINDGVVMTLNNATGTDIDVWGTIQIIGTGAIGGSISISAGATIMFESTGKYQHNFSSTSTQGTIPSATWNDGSTCEIIGFTSGTTLHAANINQSYSNFTWNCPNQTTGYGLQGLLQTIRGNFTMQSSGSTPQIVYGLGASSGGLTMTIGGDMIISGGAFTFAHASATGTFVLNLGGNYNQTGGTFQSDYAGGVAVHFTGSGKTFTKSGGTFTTTNMNFFVDNGASLTLNNNITVSTSFTVSNGGSLDFGTNIMSGGGTFTAGSGSSLIIGSLLGITSSGANGNVQVTGTRSFNTGTNYTYNGVAMQVSGNGLPSQVANLTLNNSANCILSVSTSVSGTLTFTSGIWITSGDTLTLGTSTGTLGTLSRASGHVYGYFKRWIAAATTSNILFPVGTLSYYNGANFSFTTAPTTAGSIVSTFTAVNPGTAGLPLTDAGAICAVTNYGYWTFAATNSFAGGAYSVNLYGNGFPGITDYTVLHLARRTGGGTLWTVNGTHSAATGSNSAPVVNRTGMTLLADYGIIYPTSTLPIQLIGFDAKPDSKAVALSWITSSETNNAYFTVERSANGKDFEELLKKPGAGNSTTTLHYSASDDKPLKGISFYRLKQTDYDGKLTYSAVRQVENMDSRKTNSVISIDEVYPNPFTDGFTIKYSLFKDSPVTFNLTNSSGALLSTQKDNSKEGMNEFLFEAANSLPAGTYIISILSNEDKATRRIQKK